MIKLEDKVKNNIRLVDDIFIHNNYMADKNQQELRNTILQQTDQLTFKSRFGLFSHPISTAVCDNGAYAHQPPKRGQNNKPITHPRNIVTSPTKSAKTPADFFGPLNSLSTSKVTDVYVDPSRKLLMIENQALKNGKTNDSAFIPASGTKILARSTYSYIQQKAQSLDPKRKRNQEGNVIIEARNIVTNPMKNVQRNYLKHPQHISDPYNRAHQLEQERLKKQKAKEAEVAFKLNSFSGRTFSKDVNVYGTDVIPRQLRAKSNSLNVYKHDNAFKPSSPNKKGIYGYFGEFPEHIPNPEAQTTRKNNSPDKKQAFKGMSTALSKPSPSILCNPANIRNSYRLSIHH